MNLGLYRSDNDSHMITGISNLSLSKKHLRGLTQVVDEVSQNIDFETFDEQVKSIESLIGEKVLLSSVRDIILDKNLKVNHNKFDAFKNMIRWSKTDSEKSITSDQFRTLTTPSENLTLTKQNDFSLDAYKVFHCYVQIFSREDCFIVKKETEKILKITQCFIRNERLEELLDSI
ncbi:hypothetical protein EBU94_05565 [bacterium]|nr:hypothetical protein [bacterium]